MISLRLITTGLDDVHSVIGYELGYKIGYAQQGVGNEAVLIQPRDGSKFSYEAMHDINGISIPELEETGLNRTETLSNLIQELYQQDVLVWYKPFIVKFFNQIAQEIRNGVYCDLIDVYALAKQKGLNSPSYKLADVYEYTDTDNLFDLYDYLKGLPDPQKIRRV